MYITLFVIVSAVLGALIGLWKGFRKTLSGLVAVILAALLSLFITPPILRAALSEDKAKMLAEALGFMDTYSELAAASPALEDLLLALPAALVAPIVFLVAFGIFRFIFRVVCGIIARTVLGKEKEPFKKRAIGAPLGFARGAVVALVFVCVIAGFVTTADTATEMVLSHESEQFDDIKSTLSEIDGYLSIVADDPIVSALSDTNPVFDHLTTMKIEDESVVLNEEIFSIFDAALNVLPLTENTDIKTWSDEEVACLKAFVEKFGNSKMLPTVSSELLTAACQKWSNGEAFMGIEAPAADPTIDPMLKALYVSFGTTTKETIVVDMNALVDILDVIIEHDVLNKLGSESGNALSLISGDLISDLLGIVSTSDRMSVLVPEITNLSIKVLAGALNIPESSNAIYDNFTSDISSSLANISEGEITEEKAEQFKSEMVTSLKNNGIEVSDEVANVVSESMISAFNGKNNVTQDDVKNYFADFANVYTSIEKQIGDSASNDNSIKLEFSTEVNVATGTLDQTNMSYEDKLAVLAQLKLLDIYRSKYDLSAPDNMLDNSMTAETFVNYLIDIYNTVLQNYETIKALGDSTTNPLIALKSSETIISNKLTTEELLINTDSYTLTTDDIQNIAEGVENITVFLDSVSNIEGAPSLDNLSEIDLEAAGKALDVLSSTELFQNNIGKVADTLVSNVVGENINLSDKIASGDSSYESLMTTVKSASSVIANMSKENVDDLDKESAITDLLAVLTPENADIVTQIVTESFMIKQGVPEKYAHAAATALKVALTEMATLPENEYQTEANKLKYLFDIISGSKGSSKPLIGENGTFANEDEVIDMVIGSKVVYMTLKSLTENDQTDSLGLANSLSDNEKVSLKKAIEDYYNEKSVTLDSTASAELKDKLNSIALIFDISLSIK